MTSITRIRSLDELISFIPHVLGHHPSDCLVLMATSANSHFAAARVPFVDDDTGAALADDHVVTRASHALRTFSAHGADGVYAVAFVARARAVRVLDQVVAAADSAGLRAKDVAIVDNGRRFTPLSPDVRERVDGIPLQQDGLSDCALLHVVEGSDPLPDRRSLRALVLPDVEESAKVRVVLEAFAERDAAVQTPSNGRVPAPARHGRLWAAVLGSGVRAAPVSDLSDEQVAGLVRSLSDVNWRDAIIACLLPGTLELADLPPRARRAARKWFTADCDEPRLVLHRLLALARRAPDDVAVSAGLCALVGCVAWNLGDGAIAGDAIGRALRIDPGHRLALLLAQVIDNGIRPPRGPASGRAMAQADRPAV
jgi:hypothetical protein